LSRLCAQEATEDELAIAEQDRKINDIAAAAVVCLRGTATPKKRTPTAALSSKATMIDAALDALPEWCDRDGTRKSMTRRQ
jgi:hypothetical protein